MAEVLAGLIADARLTREARIMGAHIHILGEGKHEISTEDWQRILGASRGGPPKRQTIAGWAAELELYGYVESVGVGPDVVAYAPIDEGGPALVKRSRAIPPDVRSLVFSRDGRICARCGSRSNLTLDHIVPFSQGGGHTPENLRVLCRICNASRGAP